MSILAPNKNCAVSSMISRDVARAIFKMVRRDDEQRVETDKSNSENHEHDGSDSADQDQRKDKISKKKHKKQSKHRHRKDKKHKKRRQKSQSRSNSSERSLSPHGAVSAEAIISPKRFEETNEEKENEEGKREIVLEEEHVGSVLTKDKSSSGMKEETHSNSSPECTSGRSRSRSRSRSTSRDQIKKTSHNSREASSKASRSLKSKDRAKRFPCSRSNEDKLSKRSKSRSRSRDSKRNKSRSNSRERNRRKFSRSRSRSRSRERRKYRHYDRTKKRSQSPRRGKSRRSRSKSNSRRHGNCSPRQNLHSRSQTPDHSRSKRSCSRSHSHSPYRSRRKRSRSRSSSPLYRRRRSPSPYFNRYRSRKSQSHSYRSERYSRSQSRDRKLSRHLRHSRSQSQSPRRRDRSRSSSKTKESQPAKLPMNTDVAAGLTNTDTEKPVNTSLNSQQSKVAKVSGGKTIAELTEFCKKLTAEKLAQNKRMANSGAIDEEEDITVHVSHPFLVKPAPEIIIPKVILPVKRSTENDDNKPLQEKFPVSCGDKHREKEMNNEAGNIVQGVDGTIPTAKPTNVFNEQPKEKIDISGMVVKRMAAQRRLDANPNDIEAMLILQEVQMKMSSWCQSNVKPGQFTGQLVKNLLPKDTLQAGGIQAWARKDMFQNLRPVSEGIGMKLLQKMGWKPGQVIGKRGEGYVEPIAVTVKVDRKGLISQGHEKPGSKRQQVTDVQGKHPVSALSEFCSKRRWGLPDYNLVFDHGPAHSKQFLYKVTVNGVDYQPAVVSGNKKHAKAQAAATALKGLGLLPQNAQV